MKKEILIAIFAAVTLAIAVWGYNFISGKNLFTANYTYYAYYDDVQDVNTATPVLINGYEVGTVISISPDPNNVQRIRLEFTVKNSIKLPDYTVAELVPDSPLGGKYISLVFDKMCVDTGCAPDKSVLKGRTIGMLGSLISSDDLNSTANVLSSAIDSTLSQLGAEDSADAIDISIRNLAVTLENFASISEKFNTLMTRSSSDMEKTLANMSTLTSSLVESNKKIDTMLDDLSDVTADLKGVKLSETLDQTKNTMGQAETSLKTMETTMSEASESLASLNDMLNKISAGEGTVGKLMQDEELYSSLQSTTHNLDLLIQDLRLNPRRYFRLFGKKSRDYEYPVDDPAEEYEKEDK